MHKNMTLCEDLPVKNQHACYDVNGFDSQAIIWKSVGNTPYHGSGTGTIEFDVDVSGSYGIRRDVKYLKGSTTSTFDFKSVLANEYTICSSKDISDLQTISAY